ncbi:MAG: DUF5615 family PIN-like protein [Gemmatimonadaceae bacterium]
MALHFLLDEHISPDVADALRLARPRLRVTTVRDWGVGMHLGIADDAMLAVAHAHKQTLVTYDQRTIVPLIKRLAEATIPHAGVIFVDERTFAPSDLGGLARALGVLWDELGRSDWTNRVAYLIR